MDQHARPWSGSDRGFIDTTENPWGAPCIHGELLHLGFNLSERSVSRYLRSLPRAPRAGQTWTTFLRNHRDGIAAMDFCLLES